MPPRIASPTFPAAVVATLALTVAGCGSGAPAGRAHEPSAITGTTTGTTTTATANRAAAEREAQRLLGLVPIPDGAVALTTPPDGLTDVPDRPVVDSIAVRSRFWTLPMPYQQAKKWIEAHPPAHLQWTGHGSGSGGPHGPTSNWATDQGASPAWQGARAEASLVGGNTSTSMMRVDGMAIWLDPTPYPDNATQGGGQRVRLTVAGGCPATDRAVTGVTADGPDLGSRLVPGPRPVAGLVCRYSGLNGSNGKPAMTLTVGRPLDADTAGMLAAALLALPLAHPVGEVRSCPGDDGSAVLVALAYPGRPDVDLRIATTGCSTVANGRISAEPDESIIQLLTT